MRNGLYFSCVIDITITSRTLDVVHFNLIIHLAFLSPAFTSRSFMSRVSFFPHILLSYAYLVYPPSHLSQQPHGFSRLPPHAQFNLFCPGFFPFPHPLSFFCFFRACHCSLSSRHCTPTFSNSPPHMLRHSTPYIGPLL